MTIAACSLSAEGVVFGADSTTTLGGRFFDHGQKIFPIGENTYLGMVSWGLGELGDMSYRTLIARFGDSLRGRPLQPLDKVAEEWKELFWPLYRSFCAEAIAKVLQLEGDTDKAEQEARLLVLKEGLSGGFCIGGHCPFDRTPRAIEITFDWIMTAGPVMKELAIGDVEFWGDPSITQRLEWGFDWRLIEAIISSRKWTGTEQELAETLCKFRMKRLSNVPLREAIDWVHAAIYTTIKAIKFSEEKPMCGGPVEIAVVPTDGQFRWVMRKTLGSAILQDKLEEFSND